MPNEPAAFTERHGEPRSGPSLPATEGVSPSCGAGDVHNLGERVGGEAGEFPGFQLVQPAAVHPSLAHQVFAGDRPEEEKTDPPNSGDLSSATSSGPRG